MAKVTQLVSRADVMRSQAYALLPLCAGQGDSITNFSVFLLFSSSEEELEAQRHEMTFSLSHNYSGRDGTRTQLCL